MKPVTISIISICTFAYFYHEVLGIQQLLQAVSKVATVELLFFFVDILGLFEFLCSMAQPRR
jgi:hypothetical protein